MDPLNHNGHMKTLASNQHLEMTPDTRFSNIENRQQAYYERVAAKVLCQFAHSQTPQLPKADPSMESPEVCSSFSSPLTLQSSFHHAHLKIYTQHQHSTLANEQ